jgi:mono/diheme cytochrome c family protein
MRIFKIIIFISVIVFLAAYSIISVNAKNTFKNESTDMQMDGHRVYIRNGCFTCHGKDRLGMSATPLIPEFIGRYSDDKLKTIITKGLFPVPMPSFKNLSKKDLSYLISYLKSPSKSVKWTIQDIKGSLVKYPGAKESGIKPVNVKNIMAVVEGGTGKIWIMKGERVLSKFNFDNIHGGLKYSPSGRYLYLPSTTGYVGKYDFYNNELSYKARVCRYLRNISLSEGGKYVIAACWLPESIVILNAENLEPKKIIPLKHRISVIYGLFRNGEAVFSFMRNSKIGILNTKTLNAAYYALPMPFQDFFVDPLDEYAVGGSFKNGSLNVFSLKKKRIVYSHKSYGIPHPAGASFWFRNGRFYFALTNLTKPFVSVWQMYNWKFIKNVFTGGPGFFVKTNPYTKYLWVDNSSDAVVLINKHNFHVKKIVIKKGGLVIHTQFSGNERLAYVSDYGRNGRVAIVNTNSLKTVKSIPANDAIGKYNYVNYQRMNDAALLGEEVYFTYCWGCHNPTLQSIGPSFSYIATHLNDAGIKAQVVDPDRVSKLLGYKYNAMPEFKLTKEELKALIAFIRDAGNRNFWRHGN